MSNAQPEVQIYQSKHPGISLAGVDIDDKAAMKEVSEISRCSSPVLRWPATFGQEPSVIEVKHPKIREWIENHKKFRQGVISKIASPEELKAQQKAQRQEQHKITLAGYVQSETIKLAETTVEGLRNFANNCGIKFKKGATKADLIGLIEAALEGVQSNEE